jgi:O-antigen ligase
MIKSRHFIRGVILMVVIAAAVFAQLDDIHKQRYLSMIDQDAAGRASAVGRIEHVKRALTMFSEKPLFGYGLGTYREANWNLKGEDLVSHNLYSGALVELGMLGAFIYFMFILSIFKNLQIVKKLEVNRTKDYSLTAANILESVLITQLAFSLFAGGVTYYIWFLLGGLSVATLKISTEKSIGEEYAREV